MTLNNINSASKHASKTITSATRPHLSHNLCTQLSCHRTHSCPQSREETQEHAPAHAYSSPRQRPAGP